MSDIVTSIVIPVCNKWQLTENCLRALRETLPGQGYEVVVIDNASTDETPASCPALGHALFGDDGFIYRRSESNTNFGPASNLGARLSRGRCILFLSNDTAPLPGWYEPLLRDFNDFPGIGATGPLLLYPEDSPLGRRVRHLGVFVDPFCKLGRLYEGIPASARLVRKRRFFQIISAACLLMPKTLFLEHGGFDEADTNGFGEAGLCARLWRSGHTMTVNPAAQVLQLTNHLPARHAYEVHNSSHLAAPSLPRVTPDWHLHLQEDQLELGLSDWLTLYPKCREQTEPSVADTEALCAAISRNPLALPLYARLADELAQSGRAGESASVLSSLAGLCATPSAVLQLHAAAVRGNAHELAAHASSLLFSFCRSPENYELNAKNGRKWCRETGLDGLAAHYAAWLEKKSAFRESALPGFMRSMRGLAKDSGFPPSNTPAYTVWNETIARPPREHPGAAKAEHIGISVLMPVFNPKIQHLREAVESLRAQRHTRWELCIADDCSSDREVLEYLRQLPPRDERIKVAFREQNGHISRASNTALELASYDFCALMDQDDLLTRDALGSVAEAIAANPAGMLFYSDEDKIDCEENFKHPYFKPDWDALLVLCQNYISHLGVYNTRRLREIHGFRPGFEGAQDYDLMLRFSEGLPKEALVHIPKVLYHWRIHEASTAAGVEAKPYAIASGRKAVEEHLARRGITAVLEGINTWHRPIFAPPSPLPPVSVISDCGSDLARGLAFIKVVLAVRRHFPKLDICLIHDDEPNLPGLSRFSQECALYKPVIALPLSRKLPRSVRYARAAERARGKILGFLAPDLVPPQNDWLSPLAGLLGLEDFGASTGQIITPSGLVASQGYMSDGSSLGALFRGLPYMAAASLGLNRLPHRIAAADPRFLFTTRSAYTALGGFDQNLGQESLIDYCLRLEEHGLGTAFDPGICLALAGGATPWERDGVVCAPELLRKWQGRLKAWHPSLVCGHGTWALSFKAR